MTIKSGNSFELYTPIGPAGRDFIPTQDNVTGGHCRLIGHEGVLISESFSGKHTGCSTPLITAVKEKLLVYLSTINITYLWKNKTGNGVANYM